MLGLKAIEYWHLQRKECSSVKSIEVRGILLHSEFKPAVVVILRLLGGDDSAL